LHFFDFLLTSLFSSAYVLHFNKRSFEKIPSTLNASIITEISVNLVFSKDNNNYKQVTGVYNIRQARIDDVDKVYSLIHDSVSELCKQHYSQERIDSFIDNLPGKVLYYKWLTDKIMIVCCEGDTIVGFGQFDPTAVFIDAIFVDPDHVGEGIGTKLMNYLEDVARQLKKPEIGINASVNAIQFYEKCGYQQQGTFFIDCKDGSKFETIKFSKKLLDQE
jgi:GNAT superfamily N-acetyltransferase